MRFKIYSLIFVFIACFLLISYTPIQGGEKEPVWGGAKLTDAQRASIKSQIENLGVFFKKGEFGKIGQFYKKTGKVIGHDLNPIKGKDNIEKYFKDLYGDGVTTITFTAERVYAKKLKEGTTVNNLIKNKDIEKDDVPKEISLDREVTHALRAIISISFTRKEITYNQGLPSFWDGFHIDGCPII